MKKSDCEYLTGDFKERSSKFKELKKFESTV